MALFDFLKRRRTQARHDARQEKMISKKETVPADVPKHTSEVSKNTENVREASRHTSSAVLIAPHITERARMLAQAGQYVFRIHPDATKMQVQDAVEQMYGVHVRAVQIVKAHEKPRRRGLTEGIKKGYKKAVVALREGEVIDIF